MPAVSLKSRHNRHSNKLFYLPVGVVTSHLLYGSWFKPSSTTNRIWNYKNTLIFRDDIKSYDFSGQTIFVGSLFLDLKNFNNLSGQTIFVANNVSGNTFIKKHLSGPNIFWENELWTHLWVCIMTRKMPQLWLDCQERCPPRKINNGKKCKTTNMSGTLIGDTSKKDIFWGSTDGLKQVKTTEKAWKLDLNVKDTALTISTWFSINS